jgi:cell division protein FtsB
LALTHSTQKLKKAEACLKALTREKEILENKVSLMGDKIDLSLLDLQVRLILGYVHPSELIVIPSSQSPDSP